MMILILKRFSATLLWIIMLVWMCWLPAMEATGATNNWKEPKMLDYAKDPPFTSDSVPPNVMIILDNSRSMQYNAYGSEADRDGNVEGSFGGEPYPSVRTFPVVAESDDMAEAGNGDVHDDSYDGDWDGLNIGAELVGLRFQDIEIPRGATVEHAYIYFAAQRASDETDCNVTITVQDSDDAAYINRNDDYNLSGRSTVSQSVNWNIDTSWEADMADYATPDISGLVNAIVSKEDWEQGNDILFLIAPAAGNSGLREAESNREGGAAPVLKIQLADDDSTAPETYYGYFNPDWFYTYDSSAEEFQVAYKKVSENAYDAFLDRWQVLDKDHLDNETNTRFLDREALVDNGLWDGNWLNWLTMRRMDILRKVLFGGDTNGGTGVSGRTGTGDQVIYALDTDDESAFTKSFLSTLAGGPPYNGNLDYTIRNQQIVVEDVGDSFTIKVRKNKLYEPEAFHYYDGGDNLAGVLQRVGDRANWGNMWFRDSDDNSAVSLDPDGGYVENPIGSSLVDMVADLEAMAPSTYTPLAETLYTATQYFAQQPAVGDYEMYEDNSITAGGYGDPYYMLDDSNGSPVYVGVPCADSFVLLLTDGLSTRDADVPSAIRDYDTTDVDTKNGAWCDEPERGTSYSNCIYDHGGTDYLDDVALYAHTVDLRPDLDGRQSLTLYTIYAFGGDEDARQLLQDAAKNGGFTDLNNDGLPNDPSEYDTQAPLEVPDNYFEASSGYELEDQINDALGDMTAGASSGTAASVVSNSRSGDGAVYQSIFYPEKTTEGEQVTTTVNWIGQVHALFMDAYGNLREDTTEDGILNMENDYIIQFETDDDEGNPTVNKYHDQNGNGIVDLGEESESGQDLDDIDYLWSSNDWLNNTVTDPVTQRDSYDKTDNHRYIFTFVDKDGDMVVGDGEKLDFVAKEDLNWNDVTSPDSYYAYIHTFNEPFTEAVPAPGALAQFREKVVTQTRRIVNFVRGQDQPEVVVGSETLGEFRSRQLVDADGKLQTMRLGDIVYSSPTVVGKPAENFDLIYRDTTYLSFVRAHLNRRQVIYAGANDGMLHAFNGGFYDASAKRFRQRPLRENSEEEEDTSFVNFELGAELWAYVPYNLLSHLHWLTRADYNHVYYMDLPPRVFDAKLYSETQHDETTHPNGWATILVAGMRFGGGRIAADMDKSDGPFDPAKDKILGSAYAIFDITDPEHEPELLAEISFPDLGFTTCHPGVVPDRQRNTGKNEWYLLFGSGPASPSSSGEGDVGPNNTALVEGISTQNGRLYALDLVALVKDKKVTMKTGTNSGDLKPYDRPSTATDTAWLSQTETYTLQVLSEENSSVSKPIAVDWDLDFKTDDAYFGTSFGNKDDGWGGKLRRIHITSVTEDTTSWETDSTMLDLTSQSLDGDHTNGQPIMAAPTAGIDKAGNRWIFFGTGRFMSVYDKLNDEKQSFYGIKEPLDDTGEAFSYDEVAFGSLENVSEITIYENQFAQFHALAGKIRDKSVGGWRMNFIDEGERLLSQPVLAGEILTFTTYTPPQDICDTLGTSMLYALHYMTGTAYYKNIIGLGDTNSQGEAEVFKRIPLGVGMASAPNIQIGRGSGVNAFIQSGKGGVETMDENVAGKVKSGRGYWLPDLEECEEETDVTQ